MEKPKVKMNSKIKIEMGVKTRKVTIVKSTEIDLSKGFISEDSPLGKLLVGKVEGDNVDFESPAGKVVKINIIKIEESE